jgi:hypothetical protein
VDGHKGLSATRSPAAPGRDAPRPRARRPPTPPGPWPGAPLPSPRNPAAPGRDAQATPAAPGRDALRPGRDPCTLSGPWGTPPDPRPNPAPCRTRPPPLHPLRPWGGGLAGSPQRQADPPPEKGRRVRVSSARLPSRSPAITSQGRGAGELRQEPRPKSAPRRRTKRRALATIGPPTRPRTPGPSAQRVAPDSEVRAFSHYVVLYAWASPSATRSRLASGWHHSCFPQFTNGPGHRWWKRECARGLFRLPRRGRELY